MRKLLTSWLFVTTLALSGCGYNALQASDEQIKADWSEVVNQYQRRADLVPNLVATVKGEAAFEQATLTRVVEARAQATSIQATSELVNDPQAFQKFERAQADLSTALGRLMVVSESYPTLKANEGFRELQAQLEGTENRIAVARGRYIEAVRNYNVTVRSFPSNLTAKAFGYAEKANFTVDNEKALATPPVVDLEPASQPSRSGSQAGQ